jgi:hypothetical protein
MEQLFDIVLRSFEIFILILGIIGVICSFLLMFSPNIIGAAGGWFNKYVNVESSIGYLNRIVRTDRFTYRHNILTGVALVLGSTVVLIFLFFQLPGIPFQNIVYEVIFQSAVMIGKVTAIMGFLVGSGLMFFPGRMNVIENKINSWFDTQQYVDKLNEPYPFVDKILLKHSVIFGMTGVAASALLILVAAIALFK